MKVLIADDDEITRVTLQALLSRRGYEVAMATNGIDALAMLEDPDGPSIAILDWMMPGIDGIALCRRIRASAKGAYTYVVILSAQGEKRHFKIGMDAGADDYLSKPFDAEELHLRLRAGERIVTLERRLRVEARADALTNALNRGGIMDILERELAQATRRKDPLAAMLVDVDHFKQVNDSHGHSVGDAVLQHVTQAIRGPLRAYDALGRYGGEEFLVIAPACALEEAAKVAERIRLSVEAKRFERAPISIGVTVSVGVAAGCGNQLQSGDLIELADGALYSAKRNGRNRVELAETAPAMFQVRR